MNSGTRTTRCVLAHLLAWSFVNAAAAADKVNVRLGGSSVDTTFYLARHKGFFIAVMTNNFHLRPALIRKMYALAIDLNGMVQVKSIQKDPHFFRAQGWVTGFIDLGKVIDMPFAQQASADLDKYFGKPKWRTFTHGVTP